MDRRLNRFGCVVSTFLFHSASSDVHFNMPSEYIALRCSKFSIDYQNLAMAF